MLVDCVRGEFWSGLASVGKAGTGQVPVMRSRSWNGLKRPLRTIVSLCCGGVVKEHTLLLEKQHS